MSFKLGLRSKLLLLSTLLFSIPWLGYKYVWEMEKYLRFGQEKTLVATARALATSLHERPNLFNNQASFLPSVEKGKDLYGYQITQAINLDGLAIDWPHFNDKSHYYGVDNQISAPVSQQALSLHFNAAVGKYGQYLYLFFNVIDDKTIYRAANSRAITKNDHLALSFIQPDGTFIKSIISNKAPGWIDAFVVSEDSPWPEPANYIQGHWLETPQGYNVELRIPLDRIGDNIAFAWHDVDQPYGDIKASVGSADPAAPNTLGTILVPSPEIERIVKGLSYSNSAIWVVDKHHRVLASSGNIKEAPGVWGNNRIAEKDSAWQRFVKTWLHPLYYKVLTKPSGDFIDQLYDAQNLHGEHVDSALSGNAQSQWRLTNDNKAVILSAAYPIYLDNKVNGAVVVEETTNGIRTVRNQALEKLFTAMLLIMLVGMFVFFIFASRISARIRSLNKQAKNAIDEHGKIKHQITPSKASDEIGDLSREFSELVQNLSQYNHYLENMSARLSHELKTPIAVVKTSLDNLAIQPLPEDSKTYMVRAQEGVKRLDKIFNNMSEATRLEKLLQRSDKQNFILNDVIASCGQAYKQIYPDITFNTQLSDQPIVLNGSADHIAQLLDKIITNAVEFSEDKQIDITLNVNKQHFELLIANKGPLLPEEMQSRIFDSMVSMRKSRDETTPHLGLGLYIAKLIADFHQCKIEAINDNEKQQVVMKLFN
ncbi:proteobacterial dedicated sortase system histidine kinase [Thalassotalea agarivorans]|uniref:histidine kinase n=1 Tax=Thalassotalea agarivorans TaxID=349064 RepID=A0A1I0DGI5_THASX|nr:proteobacterial dedicated sortase system histidine kinase [Thalassotalea agarivorans]SET30744.1 dedicated sortase system histidine kinase [Thalassotalea agarivorans]